MRVGMTVSEHREYNDYLRGKAKEKFEFGKLIAVVSASSSIVLTAIIVYMTFRKIDCSNLTTVTIASWAETAASNVSYYNKTKRLNLPKVIMGTYKGLPKTLRDQIDINQLMSSLMQ